MVTDVSPGEGWLHGTVNAFESHKVSTDNAETILTVARSRERLTSRRQMSSFTAWSNDVFFRQGVESNAVLSRPTDSDFVS